MMRGKRMMKERMKMMMMKGKVRILL